MARPPRLTVPALTASLAEVHDALDRFWLDAESSGTTLRLDWRLHFATAIAEVVANVITHANPEQRDDVRLSLRLRLRRDRAVATIVDGGRPLDAALPVAAATREQRTTGARERALDGAPPRASIDEGPGLGVGLAIVYATVDRVRYRRAGELNAWRLTKHL